MSLPPKAVPKSAAPAVGSGPGTGPSPPSLLRGTLNPVPLPGPPVAQQPPSVPPPQIPRLQPPLEERLYSAQPGVTAVYNVNPPYSSGQNAGPASLVYSPPTQPPSRSFQAGPRPTHHQGGFRPIQFFQRPQMQQARPTLSSNNPALRPSQPPGPAVYTGNQPIMMTMTPMPFASPQAPQYYISQYRHPTPYVGPPQQYSVQPQSPSTFYHSPGPGDFTGPYSGPSYYPSQTVFTPSPQIIVPTPQQPPPTKREKKPIRIRDPNRGGKDITEEIMSGGSGSRTSTPPAGRPSSTPTPPQMSGQTLDLGHVLYGTDPGQLVTSVVDLKPVDDKPKLDCVVQKPPSPGIALPELPPEKRDPDLPPAASVEPIFPSMATTSVGSHSQPASVGEPATPVPVPVPVPVPSPPAAPELSEPVGPLPELVPVVPAVNGLTDRDVDLDLRSSELVAPPALPQDQPPPEAPSPRPDPVETRVEGVAISAGSAAPPAAAVLPVTLTAAVAATCTAAAPPPPPGLLPPVQTEPPSVVTETSETDVVLNDKTDAVQLPNSRKSPTTALPAQTVPKTWARPREAPPAGDAPDEDPEPSEPPLEAPKQDVTHGPALEAEPEPEPDVVHADAQDPEAERGGLLPEENGEREPECDPLGNGAGHASETESSDSGVTLGLPADVLQEEPVEVDGKRQYGREFLLGFQFMPACVKKPEGLPPISDVVLDKINQSKQSSRPADLRVISRGPDFTPAFADFGRQGSGGRGTPLMNVNLRRPPPRKIITNVSVNDEVQLKKAENAWKPGVKREGPADEPDALRTQDLFRKVRSILNKLTPQMFNQLMKQVTDLTIDTEERLKGVIDLVFEKAIDEPSFSVAYGNMCRCLATLKVPMADKPNNSVNFRKLLLNRCQKEFEKDKVDDDVFERKQKELESSASASERERLQEELEEAKDKARRRSIGNIKFIGELFKLKMLTEAIMHDCVVKLLKNHDEESLECLCRLLTTIGKDLDFEKAKPRMDQYFNQMEKIVKERKTSSRIRFMLQDVIDLRLNNWVSRRADQGPKTIEQIHKEAKIEEQEEQRKVHQQLLSKDNKRRPVTQREETWNTVPMTKNSRTIDPTKIPKISKPTIDDKIQLGPRAPLSWVKGSSGGAGAKATESESRSSASSLNRYSLPQASVPPPSSSPSLTPDLDARRSLSSRSSARERSDKVSSPTATVAARVTPIPRGSGGKEPAESPVPEEPVRDAPAAPRLPAATTAGEKADVESGRPPREAGHGAAVKPEASQDKALLSEEEMERRCRSIIDEFLHINDYKEAVQCVTELEQGPQLHVFVRVGVESTLERSYITRDHMGQLFFQLVNTGALPKVHFFKGFAETLEVADDMAIDIPHIWLYLAELLNPMFRAGAISLREVFSEFSRHLLPVGRAGILFSEILHLLCKQMSHKKVGSLWGESSLSWAELLPEGEDVRDFIADHKLEFTISDCSSPTEALLKGELSAEELSLRLEKLLIEDMAGDEQIFDWVEANLDESQMSSPAFLRALMTAVCKAAVKGESTSCRVDTTIIQKRLPVLLKYLNSDTERQLQALYALQALIVKLDQPPNLLRMFFDCLYDEDVISEDAFYKWETSKDPAEELGKGVALKSVTAFFTWLREAEEESEDN
ncbi:eukaryotic translation initiation factor 4 gamma 3 isoform X3 [Paramormyrops kingsleyae]|uniref:eukaryotic translation initiation factor 4 gamma 3 isoform X3 n=1 Tax=Paramormyrops kingsleyae TaxID=1676925 RepID=UPI003B96B0F1